MSATPMQRHSEEQITESNTATLSMQIARVSRFLSNHTITTSTVGVVWPPLFFAVMLVLGASTPGYNAISRFGSELSLAPLGWIMIANFVGLGLVESTFGFALYRAIGNQRSGRIGAAMVATIGLAFLDAGVFVTDLNGEVVTIHGALHFLAAFTIFFVAAPTGAIALAWRFRRDHVFAAYSALTGVSTPLLFVATVVSGNVLGLMERIVIAVVLTWLSVLALRFGRWSADGVREDARRRGHYHQNVRRT